MNTILIILCFIAFFVILVDVVNPFLRRKLQRLKTDLKVEYQSNKVREVYNYDKLIQERNLLVNRVREIDFILAEIEPESKFRIKNTFNPLFHEHSK